MISTKRKVPANHVRRELYHLQPITLTFQNAIQSSQMLHSVFVESGADELGRLRQKTLTLRAHVARLYKSILSYLTFILVCVYDLCSPNRAKLRYRSVSYRHYWWT